MQSIHRPSSRRASRSAVVADLRIVGPQRQYEVNLHAIDLRPCCTLRLPQDISGDREAFSLLREEVGCNERWRGTAEIVDAVRPILTNVDLAVRIRGAIDVVAHGLVEVQGRASGYIKPGDPHGTDEDQPQGAIGVFELIVQVLTDHALAVRNNVQALGLQVLDLVLRLRHHHGHVGGFHHLDLVDQGLSGIASGGLP